jgi:Kef-type K+ transport system membrane component KefB
MSVALVEIMVGAMAGNTIGLQLAPWVNFLAGFGAILLTFLAGTEIDSRVLRKHFWSSMGIGVLGFLGPLTVVARALFSACPSGSSHLEA